MSHSTERCPLVETRESSFASPHITRSHQRREIAYQTSLLCPALPTRIQSKCGDRVRAWLVPRGLGRKQTKSRGPCVFEPTTARFESVFSLCRKVPVPSSDRSPYWPSPEAFKRVAGTSRKSVPPLAEKLPRSKIHTAHHLSGLQTATATTLPSCRRIRGHCEVRPAAGRAVVPCPMPAVPLRG